jgi:uncharacterized membrane protein
MKILSLLKSKENLIDATIKFLSLLNVKVTNLTLEKDLYNHPDYPSLLSVNDVLTEYGVGNVSLKVPLDQLVEIPTPFIALIKGEAAYSLSFTIVETISGDNIKYYNPEKYQWENISRADFEKTWSSGVVLLADAEGATGEKDYSKKRREEKRLKIAKYVTFLTLPVFTIIACLTALIKYSQPALFPVIFTVFTLLGCIVGGLLLWYGIDEYNPVAQQICGAGKKTNCGAVLNSKASKIAGISWSVIGFTYFAGGLFTLLFTGILTTSTLFILAWLNVLAVPYVFFSVYYQWRIAKQWCVLCLSVQGLLVLQLVTAFAAGWHTTLTINEVFNSDLLIPVLFAYAIPFIIVSLLLPAYRSAKENKRNKTELQRLKHNPQIFEALLGKQKTITESAVGLGIVLGNPDATHKIIKVCNPYCGPCAKAHVPMEELLHNNPDLQIQIIFYATNDEGDKKAPPVKHLLAIAGKGSEQLTQQALDDWYLPEKKDYEVFAAKYPMNGELKQQDDKVNAMHNWCNKTEIAFTPTFFVNGYQLPEMYSVSDLKYFLTV